MRNLIPFLEYYLRPLPGFAIVQPWLERVAVSRWEHTGLPPAPRTLKADMIACFAEPGRRVLVETGTFYGDTLALLRNRFDELHSIELSPRLVRRARRRFHGEPKIRIHEGNSGDLLGSVLQELRRPAVIWLDGHYSGPLTARGATDTPLRLELQEALTWGTDDDAILIDDARLLGVDPAYPAVEEVSRRIHAARPDWMVDVQADMLRAFRRRS